MKAKIANLNINFEFLGSGANIIILHGWQDNITNWYQVQRLLAKNYRIFLLDLPGFGKSENPKSIWGVKEYALFVSSFVKELEIKKPIVVGHSFGGMIAAHFAANNSKSVKKLILISSAGVKSRSSFVNFKINIFKIGGIFFKLAGLSNSKYENSLKSKIGSRDYKSAKELRETFKKVVNQSIEISLSKIKAQTLILWGDKDKELNLSLSKVFKKNIPNSHIKVLWGTGHFPHIEAPKLLAKSIHQFINE